MRLSAPGLILLLCTHACLLSSEVGAASIVKRVFRIKDKSLLNLDLYSATFGYRIEEGREALEKGADPDWESEDGDTPLLVNLKFLTAYSKSDFALMLVPLVKDLEHTGAEGLTALQLAARQGFPDIVEALVRRGAKIDAVSSDGKGKTALNFASERDVASALEHGADRFARTVTTLLSLKANPNVMDSEGNTPLMVWSSKVLGAWRKEVVAALCIAGADVEARNRDGDTPLISAVRKGNSGIAQVLIDQGADFHATDRAGQTVLEIESQSGGFYPTIRTAIHAEDAENARSMTGVTGTVEGQLSSEGHSAPSDTAETSPDARPVPPSAARPEGLRTRRSIRHSPHTQDPPLATPAPTGFSRPPPSVH
uniref:Uncharacterized protein n=1 Tax=Chromera velia CCMP2878 TaxID=1169474 RepID=A0A0G4FX32_9ALVE|eukprot:Cvel_19051.t1-p1 / transcript=Cvel_19051.t1 / gene=Cvel_19051 / organism=Chromera_velia_CCMP2878 / gene_product=Putative ankyrin repeat protein MM_0045, putative / transcript_product=Putative ankyrin repeat protein MM_0045, putative / location=Cvel_scaffold1615:28758-29858(+) / protein_length=367 / sequence_SO=supercontig / SO=protein_coding / is_pseudo=false